MNSVGSLFKELKLNCGWLCSIVINFGSVGVYNEVRGHYNLKIEAISI
jgi:hypothetical protein